jgi:2-methylcitrate dehydratase PrpD
MQVQDQSQQEGLPADVGAVGTATERLADHVSGLRFESLPDDVVTKVKELLVHHLGVALRGHADPTCQQVVHAAHYLSGGSGSCAVIGERQPATLLDTVLANSFLMSYAGMDDFSMPGGVHPGILIHPTGLAVGELNHSSGREFITAVVAGYDVVTKLARPLFAWNLPAPRMPFMVYGPFASATVAARLFHLTQSEFAHTLALAAHGGMGLVAGGVFVPVQAQVARNGVMAAVLARAGMQEMSTMIEGEGGVYRSHGVDVPDGLGASLKTLGDEYEVLNAIPKRYRGSGLNIVPMEVTLALVEAHALQAEKVARIDVILPRVREEREQHRESEARHHPVGSVRFLVAGVVATGTIDPLGFVQSRDERLDGVLETVHLRFEPDHPSRYCRIEIATTGGETVAAEAADHVFPPVPWDQWLTEGGRDLFSPAQLDRLLRLVQDLEHVDDVQELTRCLVPE